MSSVSNEITSSVVGKKRGRKPKSATREYQLDRSQSKFVIDLSKEKKKLEELQNVLVECNQKDFGKEINAKELFIYLMDKLNKKDIEKIKEDSMTEMERVQKALTEYNKKNNTNLELGEFLVKKLSL